MTCIEFLLNETKKHFNIPSLFVYVPDIVVKPTIEGIKKGKDELIEKAIKLIKGL